MDYLSDEVVRGLSVLGDEQVLTEEAFKKLVDGSLKVLELALPPSELLGTVKGDAIAVKQGHAALCEFLLEAAKLNADPTVLEGILEEQKVGATRRAYVVTQYKQAKAALRNALAQTSFHPPKVVDVDWRLDYFLKANSVEKINLPVYRIVLQTTKQDGTTVPVELACTQEQLQDLVAKLKDASKQIDRSAGRA